MKSKFKVGLMLLSITAILFIASLQPAFGLRNPAAVYCEELGYEYITVNTDDGHRGICNLSGTWVNAWWFLRGEVTLGHSYCEKMGYEIKTVEDSDICSNIYSNSCSVCVLDNGTEVEVSELMGLSFVESVCGDDTCGLLENYSVCPQDCPSGGFDEYCDGMEDGVCDPDCVELREHDPDCEEAKVPLVSPIGLAAIVGLLTVSGLLALRRK